MRWRGGPARATAGGRCASGADRAPPDFSKRFTNREYADSCETRTGGALPGRRLQADRDWRSAGGEARGILAAPRRAVRRGVLRNPAAPDTDGGGGGSGIGKCISQVSMRRLME